jgi:hypothetical protein
MLSVLFFAVCMLSVLGKSEAREHRWKYAEEKKREGVHWIDVSGLITGYQALLTYFHPD